MVEGKATRRPDRRESECKGQDDRVRLFGAADAGGIRGWDQKNARSTKSATEGTAAWAPGAPVSTPLHWDEVNDKLNPSIYTMEAVPDRLDRHGDLYEGVLKTKQRLGPALRALEG